LMFVGVLLQVALGTYTIISKSVCPEAAMAENLELEEELEEKKAELKTT